MVWQLSNFAEQFVVRSVTQFVKVLEILRAVADTPGGGGEWVSGGGGGVTEHTMITLPTKYYYEVVDIHGDRTL